MESMVPLCDKRYHIYNRFRHFWPEIKKLWNYPFKDYVITFARKFEQIVFWFYGISLFNWDLFKQQCFGSKDNWVISIAYFICYTVILRNCAHEVSIIQVIKAIVV